MNGNNRIALVAALGAIAAATQFDESISRHCQSAPQQSPTRRAEKIATAEAKRARKAARRLAKKGDV